MNFFSMVLLCVSLALGTPEVHARDLPTPLLANFGKLAVSNTPPRFYNKIMRGSVFVSFYAYKDSPNR